jgi:Protein kinase domain/PEGA domain
VTNEGSGNGLDATMREFAAGQKLFRRYTLKRTLGRGGMGIVWLARDDELERDVALKFLPDLIIHDRAVLSDLKRETRRSLELTHKNIVRIYDFVHDETSGCISMEYVDGDTLSNLRADRPQKVFEPAELKEWISQLCSALDYAHNHARIVHRDLKPANLMVNQRGDMKVADFGIARSLSDSMSMLTMDRGKSGTLLYMSPQQLDGERGTHLDDVYSLGASVYELLTSKPPFYSGNVDRQIREKIPPPMTQRRRELEIEGDPIDETWEDVVRRCLAKDPAKRPQSVTEVAKRLEVPSPKTRRAARSAIADAKLKPNVFIIGAAIVLLIGIVVWFLYRDLSKRPTATATAPAPMAAPSQPSAAPTIPAPAVGGAIVDTSPSGAAVTLNGRDVGKTPLTLRGIAPGKYSMRVLFDGYEPLEKEIEVKANEFADLGAIALARPKAVVDLSSTPAGAKVLQNGAMIGTTPLRRDDFGPGEATFVVTMAGYLPHEVKANLTPRQTFRQEIALAKAAPIYTGEIRVRSDANAGTRPITIVLASDLRSGTMTQESKRGDFTVKFSGAWEGSELRAVTGGVIAQPAGVRWTPESFSLRFGDDGKTGTYECVSDGKTYTAALTATAPALSGELAKIAPIYKGTINGSSAPLIFNFSSDRKSGTRTEGSKSGDVIVKFAGIWDGTTLHAVTGDVVAKPPKVQWQPESFTLRFDPDGKRGTYECVSEGKTYTADLATP